GELCGGGNREREQRSQDDFGAFAQRLLRALARALRRGTVVLDQELDVGILEFGERHLGRVLHRLRGDAGIAGARQRQDQADLELSAADRDRILRRARGSFGLRVERVGELAKALLHAGAGPEQRRAEDEANRRPPGRSRWLNLGVTRARHSISSLGRPESARTPSSRRSGGADSGILSANG